jgi:hypothetical protein
MGDASTNGGQHGGRWNPTGRTRTRDGESNRQHDPRRPHPQTAQDTYAAVSELVRGSVLLERLADKHSAASQGDFNDDGLAPMPDCRMTIARSNTTDVPAGQRRAPDRRLGRCACVDGVNTLHNTDPAVSGSVRARKTQNCRNLVGITARDCSARVSFAAWCRRRAFRRPASSPVRSGLRARASVDRRGR